MVLIYLDNCTQKSRQLRFRPLAGIMVLINRKNKNFTMCSIVSFRPLAGIMVLIQKGVLS